MQKVLRPVKGSTRSLLERIRENETRKVNIRKPRFSILNDSGKTKVLGLSSGNRLVGTVDLRSNEVSKLNEVKNVVLTIGWNTQRNEVIHADLVTA